MKQKRKLGRKLLSFLLTLAMVVGLMPGMSLTAYAADYENIEITSAVFDATSVSTLKDSLDGFCKLSSAEAKSWDPPTKSGNVRLIRDYGEDYIRITIFVDGKYVNDAGISLEQAQAYHECKYYYAKKTVVAVNSVTLSPATVTLTAGGDAVALTAAVAPDNATDKKVVWSVGGTNAGAVKLYTDEACNTEVGTDATETLTVYAKGESAGSATITCTSNADNTKTASCAVTVKSLSKLTLNVGENGKVVMGSGIYGKDSTQGLNVTDDADLKGSLKCPENYFINVHEGVSINIQTGGEISFYPGSDNTGTITATPADGYAFAGWYNGETLYSDNAELEYKNISEDLDLTAQFVSTALTPVVSDFTYSAPSALAYDGNAKAATVVPKEGVTGMGNVTVKYFSDPECTAELVGTPTDVGTYYVGITVAEGDNYSAVSDVLHDSNWKFTISKADAVAATVTVNNRTYDGTDKALVNVTGEAKGGEMQYALGTKEAATEEYTASIPTATEVGTYYVWYKVVGDENYIDTEPACVKVTITEEKKQDEPVKPNEPDTPDTPAKTVDMYRIYNPNSGEHFYTANAAEKDNLVSLGWTFEGVGWKAPATSNTPVYRVYNPNAGDHHYTTNKAEKDLLISVGWKDEGIGWYSDDAQSLPIYRQYNPNAVAGAHNFTSSKGENDWLVSVGWKGEGIGWYGVK